MSKFNYPNRLYARSQNNKTSEVEVGMFKAYNSVVSIIKSL